MTTFPIDPLFTDESRCKNCAAFVSDLGQCRRRSPGSPGDFPGAHPTEFCMEWVSTRKARDEYYSLMVDRMPPGHIIPLPSEPNPKP